MSSRRQVSRAGTVTCGPASEGLQCCLRPDENVWQASERPTFKVDIRNGGKRIFAFPASQHLQLCRIFLDGRWYRWSGPAATEGQLRPLAPGWEFGDIPIILDEHFGIALGTGKHLVRVAFSLEGIEVVSNPVHISVLPSG